MSKNQERMLEYCLDIHRSIRAMHQRNRTVALSYGSELRIAETSVLVELLANGTLIPSELTETLLLSRVAVTRVLKRLETLDLIALTADSDDKRKKLVRLTRAGKRRAQETVDTGRAVFESAYQRLTRSDQKMFLALMRKLCKGLGAPSVALCKGDAPAMTEMRQITRVFGFLGDSVFDTGLSPLEWHILAKTCTSEQDVLIQDLALYHSVNQNTVTHAALRLERQGLLRKVVSKTDKRKRPLLPTAKGNRLHQGIERDAALQLRNALASCSLDEIKALAKLWVMYSGRELPENTITLNDNARIEPVATEEARLEAREYLFKECVSQNLLASLPERNASSESVIYVLRYRNNIHGLLESSEDPSTGRIAIQHFLISMTPHKKSVTISFVKRVVKELLRSYGGSPVYLEQARTSKLAWTSLVPKASRAEAQWTLAVPRG